MTVESQAGNENMAGCQTESRSSAPQSTECRESNSQLTHAIEQLVSGDFNTRWNAVKILKSMGEEAHPPLISIVESKTQDSDLLNFIAEVLGCSPSPQGTLALVHLLKHCRDEDVQETAILTLAKQGASCVPDLIAYLDNPTLQGAVLKALIQMNHPATIEGFLNCIDHQYPHIRTLAFEGLGQFHQATITPVLIQGLQDSDPNVRGTCLKALGLREQATVDEALISVVSPLLYDAEDSVSHLAAKTLGRFNHPLALEYLWHRLLEPSHSSTMVTVLIQSLGWAGHVQGIHYLLKLLNLISGGEVASLRPQKTTVVLELIQTLAALHDATHAPKIEAVLSPLLSLTESPFETTQVKQALTMAIAQLGQDRSIPHLIQVLNIDDARLRLHVIAALKQLNRDLSYEQLVVASQDLTLESALATGIAIALKEW